jgi:hypothetical protein
MSSFHEIQALLDKYWEGETSLDEERRLQSYFAAGDVDPRLLVHAPLFQAIKEEKLVQLEQKPKVVPIRPQMYWAAAASVALLMLAGAWWLRTTPDDAQLTAETTLPAPSTLPAVVNEAPKTTTAPLASAAPVKPKVRSPKAKSAAYKPPKQEALSAEEVAAMEEIKAALALVSSKLKKGRNEAAKGASHLDNVDRIFKKKEG